jgi:hypothetical protein
MQAQNNSYGPDRVNKYRRAAGYVSSMSLSGKTFNQIIL